MKNFILLVVMISSANAYSVGDLIERINASEKIEQEKIDLVDAIHDAYTDADKNTQLKYDACIKDNDPNANCENDILGDIYN